MVTQDGVVPVLVEIGPAGVGDHHDIQLAFVGCVRIGQQPPQFFVGHQCTGGQADDGDVLTRPDLGQGLLDCGIEIVDAHGDRIGQEHAVLTGDRVGLHRPRDGGAVVGGERAAENLLHNDVRQETPTDREADAVQHQGLVGGHCRRC